MSPFIGTAVENPPEQEAESLILKAIRSIRYGSVEVTIHNARVVQVDRRAEKNAG